MWWKHLYRVSYLARTGNTSVRRLTGPRRVLSVKIRSSRRFSLGAFIRAHSKGRSTLHALELESIEESE